MQEYSLVALPEDAGKRLDVFLADYSRQNDLGLSRQSLQKLILQGAVSLKHSGKLKAHYKIKNGDEIHFSFAEKKENTLEAEDIPLAVVYEDKDLAIIDKPIGLVVHPAPGNYTHTLVNALLHRFTQLSDINPQRPGIVHRLDKDTSGLLVIAKNNSAHLNLAKQFAEHSILRKYVALVKGEVKFNEDVIDLPIGRHPVKRKSMAVGFSEEAKFAKTRYRTLKRTKDISLLELEPFTGRTHQLRVHLSFLGHPILGDTKYGKDNAFSRLALHAKYLGFIHPSTHKFIDFSSETPQEFLKAIEKNKT